MTTKDSIKSLSGGYAQVAAFFLLTLAAILAHGSSVLNYAFPVMATALGLLLFITKRAVYIAFMWWIWLFTPLVRRLIDYHSGYHTHSPVLLTPLLVTGLCLTPLIRRPKFILKRPFLPFLLIFIVYLYALSTGFALNSPVAALFDFVNYIVPFGFALFLMDDRERFAENRAALMFSSMVGLLVIGLYGLYQFYHMPPWDAFWLSQSKFASAGSGIAEQTRLFGTLNSPGPYATVLMMSLVLVLVLKGPLRIFAAAFGFPAFGLSLVRSDWGGWVLATIFIAMFIGGKTRVRLILMGFVVVLMAYPLVTVGPVADALQKRLATFNNIQQDGSYRARQDLYESFTITAISQPVGIGFGGNGNASKLGTATGVTFDSGVLQVPYQFGWVFSPLFIWGIGMILFRTIGRAMNSKDNIAIAGAAIYLVMLLENAASPMFPGVNGMVTWIGAAIALGPLLAASPLRARVMAAARRPLAIPGILHEN